jgi:hypothetical protein
MISNPNIFSYDSKEVREQLKWAEPISLFIGKWSNRFFGASEERFS